MPQNISPFATVKDESSSRSETSRFSVNRKLRPADLLYSGPASMRPNVSLENHLQPHARNERRVRCAPNGVSNLQITCQSEPWSHVKL